MSILVSDPLIKKDSNKNPIIVHLKNEYSLKKYFLEEIQPLEKDAHVNFYTLSKDSLEKALSKKDEILILIFE